MRSVEYLHDIISIQVDQPIQQSIEQNGVKKNYTVTNITIKCIDGSEKQIACFSPFEVENKE